MSKGIGLEIHEEDFHRDFRKLLTLNVSILRKFTEIVRNEEGIGIDNEEIAASFIESAGLKIEDLNSLTRVSRHIFKRSIEKDVSTEDLISEIQNYSANNKLTLSNSKIALLRKLFDIDQMIKQRIKVEPYRKGVVNIIRSLTGVVDLRAVYNDENENNLECFIPMLIVKIKSMDEEANEHDFICQMDYENLKKMIELLEKYKDKLEIIKNTCKDKIEIYELKAKTELEKSVE